MILISYSTCDALVELTQWTHMEAMIDFCVVYLQPN